MEASRKPFLIALLVQNPTCREELLEKLMNLLYIKVGHKFFFMTLTSGEAEQDTLGGFMETDHFS